MTRTGAVMRPEWAGDFPAHIVLFMVSRGFFKARKRTEKWAGMRDTNFETKPFSFGIEGERWDAELPGLVIPEKEGGPYLCVISGRGGFAVVSKSKWVEVDDLIMAVAVVHEARREASGGKEEV